MNHIQLKPSGGNSHQDIAFACFSNLIHLLKWSLAIAFYKYVIFPYLITCTLNRVSNGLDVFLLVLPIEESDRL